MTTTDDRILLYRVRQTTTHPERWVRKAWYGRTWQAEPEEGIAWCPRGYTKAGALRKARRWRGYSWERMHRMVRRRVLVRAHITRRNDPHYAMQRWTLARTAP